MPQVVLRVQAVSHQRQDRARIEHNLATSQYLFNPKKSTHLASICIWLCPATTLNSQELSALQINNLNLRSVIQIRWKLQQLVSAGQIRGALCAGHTKINRQTYFESLSWLVLANWDSSVARLGVRNRSQDKALRYSRPIFHGYG